jgi:hypothetical protein
MKKGFGSQGAASPKGESSQGVRAETAADLCELCATGYRLPRFVNAFRRLAFRLYSLSIEQFEITAPLKVILTRATFIRRREPKDHP